MSSKSKSKSKAEQNRKAEPSKAEQKAATVTVDTLVHATLWEGFKTLTVAALAVRSLENEARQNRSGNYVRTVELGITAQSFDVFDSEWNLYRDALISNADGIAVAMGCEPSKKSEGKYTVPSGLSSAVSVVRDALRFGVSLKTPKGTPRAFADIRSDASKAKKAAEQKAAMKDATPTEQAQAAVIALLDSLKAAVPAMTREDAEGAAKILQNLLTVADGSAKHEKAEKKAA